MTPLLIESWTWWSFVTLLYFIRVWARVSKEGTIYLGNGTRGLDIRQGLKRSKIEDYLMAFAWSFYTADVVTMNITANQHSNLLPPGYLNTHVISPQEHSARQFGSVMTMVVEQCQISTIWLIKICVLIMWKNLTSCVLHWRHRIVVSITIYVIFCWALMEILYFGVWCSPFYDYFAVPTPNPKQCAAAWNHLITNASMNVSSDLMLLGLSISIVFEKLISLKLKISFGILAILGAFVVACAVANKAYSWKDPFGSQWTYWYIREASAAMIVSNIPYVFQIIIRYRDKRVYNAEGTLETASRRTSIWRKVQDLSNQIIVVDEEPSRLGSSAETSLSQTQKEEYECGKTDLAFSDPTDIELGTHLEAVCNASKNKKRTAQSTMQELEQYRCDDRTRKFPSLASTASMGFEFPSTTGAQEPMPLPRTYAKPTPRTAPAILPASRRLSRTFRGWISPAEWDTSAQVHLQDVSGLAKTESKKGSKKG